MDQTGKIILGTAQLGLSYGINNNTGRPSDEETFSILKTAYDSGVGILDTAEAYGDAQKRIGMYHRQFPKRKFRIITKLSGHFSSGSAASITVHIERLMDEMNVEELEGLMFHSFSDYQKNNSQIPELAGMKKAGKIRNIGVSVYTNPEVEEVIDDHRIDFIQLPFNLLDNDNKRGEVLARAKACGKEIHTRSVFLQGLFFLKDLMATPVLLPLKKYIDRLTSISEQCGKSIQELALLYAFTHPLIDRVLIGLESRQQLIENLSVLRSAGPLDFIDSVKKINVHEADLLNPTKWK